MAIVGCGNDVAAGGSVVDAGCTNDEGGWMIEGSFASPNQIDDVDCNVVDHDRVLNIPKNPF